MKNRKTLTNYISNRISLSVNVTYNELKYNTRDEVGDCSSCGRRQ